MISFYVNSTPTSVNQLYKRSKHGGIVLDSMNKIVYEDDSQIYELLCRKELSAVPRTVITVTELF